MFIAFNTGTICFPFVMELTENEEILKTSKNSETCCQSKHDYSFHYIQNNNR